MNKNDNLRLIRKFGDEIQLQFGNEFGYYAKDITDEQLYKFCNEANINDHVKKSGFRIEACEDKLTKKVELIAVNQRLSLSVELKLFDNSLYFNADDKEWPLIDETMFLTVQKLWRKFIAKHNWEYQKHLNMLDTLNMTEPCFSY